MEAVQVARKRYWGSLGWGSALLLLLIVVVYLPALRGGFIWDDEVLVTENPMIKASDGLHRFWSTTEPLDYWPLTYSLWWLEWRLWGRQALGYHAVNVLLHALNAILVWMVLQRLKVPGAWFAGLLFAVHPVNVATAAWISEQKNTLSMCFYAVAILLYLKFDQERRWRWYGLSLAAFLLALLSKAAVVVLPVVLLLCLWWLHGSVRRRDWLSCVPFFVLSLALGLVTVWFQYHRAMGGHTTRADDFLSRLAAAGWVPWFYLGKLLLPLRLAVIYPKWDINGSRWISHLPGMALAGCFAVLWWKRKTWGRPVLFGLGYFVVTLFPVMGFFRQGFFAYSLVADHWQYYSSVGVMALVAAAGVTVCRRMDDQRQRLATAVGITIVIMLGMGTWRRASIYRTNETLWRDTVTKNPNAWLAHYNLGNARARAGDLRQAIRCYEQALRLRPDYADAQVNLGDALLRVGRTQEAVDRYEEALRLQPDKADIHNNLGFALSQTARAAEAVQHYERALQLKPDFAAAHYNLGNALLEEGRIEDAITHYEQVVRIKPDDADAHNNLAFALLREGRIQGAISHAEEALRTRPGFAEAHYNLGNALLQEGRLSEARTHYAEALRLKPDFAEAQNQLARTRPAP